MFKTDAEELQALLSDRRDRIVEGFQRIALLIDKAVAPYPLDGQENPVCGGGLAVAELRIEGQAIDFLSFHLLADLPFDQRPDQQGQEVHRITP